MAPRYSGIEAEIRCSHRRKHHLFFRRLCSAPKTSMMDGKRCVLPSWDGLTDPCRGDRSRELILRKIFSPSIPGAPKRSLSFENLPKDGQET